MGVVLLWWALAAGASAVPSAAPPSPDDPATIVITGERARRSLKETSSSVAVFGKGDIERMAAPDRLQQLLELVPNVLQVSNRDTPTIRGQSTLGALVGLPAFLGGARPRTVVQVDGRTISFNEFANSSEGLWDVADVEVFRSPQTTTQGANSIAGAIFITTADPSWEPEARIRAIVGGDRRRQLSIAASAPLVDDQLAVRVAADLYRSHASDLMIGPVVGANLNLDNYGTARVKLRAEPRAVPGLRVLATYVHEKSEAPQGEGARAPFSDRRDIPCICGYIKTDVDAVTTKISYSVTDSLESRTTLDWGGTSYRRLAVQGFGQSRVHTRDRSVESVLEWKSHRSVSAVGGFAYQRTGLDQFIDLSATPLNTGTFDDRQDSSGFFSEVTWKPVPRLALTGGGRYQWDRQRRTGVLRTVPEQSLNYDRTFRVFLPKISATYDVTSDVRLGVLAERAYNPGGVTLEPSHSAIVLFDPEYLWDYEAYARASLFGGTVSVNANLFYDASKDVQRVEGLCLEAPDGCVFLERVVNDPRAHTSGAELELAYRPAPGVTFKASAGWLGSRVDKTVLPDDPISGKEFGSAPRFTGVLAADFNPLPHLHLSSQIRHNSSYFTDDAASEETRIRPSTDVDGRLAWETKRLTVFAYAHNLFDEFHVTFWGDVPTAPDVEVGTNDPREIGLGVEARF
jgi:outer membrane receptor protein involved in Fe transport